MSANFRLDQIAGALEFFCMKSGMLNMYYNFDVLLAPFLSIIDKSKGKKFYAAIFSEVLFLIKCTPNSICSRQGEG
jgi:hypothetical protein